MIYINLESTSRIYNIFSDEHRSPAKCSSQGPQTVKSISNDAQLQIKRPQEIEINVQCIPTA